MFALRVEYLTGHAWAASYRDRDEPEWPPHPNRMFSALVAAAFECGQGAPALAALRWLEAQPPPSLHFQPDPARRTSVTTFVPVNDEVLSTKTGIRDRQPRAFPCVGLDGTDAVGWFVWEASPDEPTLNALRDLAAEVPRLGHSASLVRVSVDPEPPAPNLVPSPTGELALRVPTAGRLDTLEAVFTAGRRPTDGMFERYGRPDAPVETVATGPFGDLRVLRLVSIEQPRVYPTVAASARLAEALRNAWMKALGADVPAVVHGHDGPHAAILPLPNVGHARADGRILGVGVALPVGLHASVRSTADRACAALRGLEVWLGSAGAWRLEPAEPDGPSTLEPATWLRPSRWWATVSPIVLDRFPRRSLTESEIVATSVRLAGYPAPTRVLLDREARVSGVPPAFRFMSRGGPRRPVFHAILTFDTAVAGPMVVGQLRHFGLGLLRPLSEGSARHLLGDDAS